MPSVVLAIVAVLLVVLSNSIAMFSLGSILLTPGIVLYVFLLLVGPTRWCFSLERLSSARSFFFIILLFLPVSLVFSWWEAARCDDCTLAVSSPTGQFVATVNQKLVSIWDIRTGVQLCRLPTSKRKVTTVAFSQDESLLAVGEIDGEIAVWDVQAQSRVRRLSTVGPLRRVAFIDNERLMAVGLQEVKRWNLSQQAPEGVFIVANIGYEKPVVLDQDNELLAVPDNYGIGVDFWNIWTGEPEGGLHVFSSNNNKGVPILSGAFMTDRKVFVVGTLNGTVIVWERTESDHEYLDLDHYEPERIYRVCTGRVSFIGFEGRSKKAIVCCSNSAMSVLDIDSGKRFTFDEETRNIRSLSVSSNAGIAAVVLKDGQPAIYDVHTRTRLEFGWHRRRNQACLISAVLFVVAQLLYIRSCLISAG